MSIALRLSRSLVPYLLAAASLPAVAQFAMLPSPVHNAPHPSQAESGQAYRFDGAQHLYAAYPMRLYKGRLPPLLYGVMITEIDVDADGAILDVRVRRAPAAPEVGPWVVQLIRRAGPFPPPARLGRVTYTDIWLVHKSGNFQLDTLTEGQD